MNSLMIIGNLTRDPELRTTATGLSVCSFTVAVRRQKKVEGQPEADFFNVTAWRERGESCAKYLSKGKKVSVVGPVSIRTFQKKDGTGGASMEVTANEIEFLSGRNENDEPAQASEPVKQASNVPTGFTQVEMGDDELPF